MTGVGGLAAVTVTVLVALVLTRAAWHKAGAFAETLGFAAGYRVLPDRWLRPVLTALILAEAGAVLLLLLPATRAFGALMAAGLFAGYGGLMAQAMARGLREIDCGCGGAPQVVSGLTLGRNAVLTVLSLAIALVPAGPVGPWGALVAILGGLTFFAILAVAEKLAAHLPNIRRAA